MVTTDNNNTGAATNDVTSTNTTPSTKPVKKAKAKSAKPHVKDVKVAKDQSSKKPAKKAAVKKASKPAKKAAKPAKKVVKAKASKPAKKSAKPSKRTADNFNRNFGRIKVNGETLSKGRAVHAVVAAHIEKKKPTLAQLKATFPDELLKNYGVIQEIGKARKYSVNGKTRYFVNKEDVLTTKDGKSIAVCNQFSTENVKPFIKTAKTLGITMTPVK
jgi:hypothetical protein